MLTGGHLFQLFRVVPGGRDEDTGDKLGATEYSSWSPFFAVVQSVEHGLLETMTGAHEKWDATLHMNEAIPWLQLEDDPWRVGEDMNNTLVFKRVRADGTYDFRCELVKVINRRDRQIFAVRFEDN